MSTLRLIGPVRAAGLTLGMGMGGFFDGILFHQILQVHNMLSARIPIDNLIDAKVNMLWDGVFHAAVWLLTACGIAMLWRAARRTDAILSTPALIGSLLMGWGTFNVIEGVIDHHVLHLHHVYEVMGQSTWDYAFLGWGAIMLLVGWTVVSKEARASA